MARCAQAPRSDHLLPDRPRWPWRRAWCCWRAGKAARLRISLLALSVAHHFFMYLVFRRIFQAAVARSRWAIWYPVANVVVDLILILLFDVLDRQGHLERDRLRKPGTVVQESTISRFQNDLSPAA